MTTAWAALWNTRFNFLMETFSNLDSFPHHPAAAIGGALQQIARHHLHKVYKDPSGSLINTQTWDVVVATNNNLSCGKTIGGSRLPRALSSLNVESFLRRNNHHAKAHWGKTLRWNTPLSRPAQRGSVCTIRMFQRLRFAPTAFFPPTYINICMITKCLVIIEVKHKVSDSGLQIKEDAMMLDTEEALLIWRGPVRKRQRLQA